LQPVIGKRLTPAGMVAGLCAVLVAAPAQAAKQCAEPAADWEHATPAEAGMDGAKLQEALDYGTTQASFAVRVYRHGCLVGEDRLAAQNRNERYESYSMAKSVTALLFGRAMTLRLISADDPVGALVPEADAAHGQISMLDLLTMTSGLEWNGFRDYNVTMQDRVRDALTLRPVHPPSRYYEYAQSPVALLAEATGRAAGEDPQAFFQRELLDTLGISADSWEWKRDGAGHILGFMGVNMRPDDFGRLGDLMRRGGVWRGRRLLSREFVTNAVAPSRTNGCYGWYIWVNAGKPCIGVTVSGRGVSEHREFPSLPADMYNFSGLFGQLVSVFPTQDIVVVRTGQDPGVANTGSGEPGWEEQLYQKVLASVTDQAIVPPGDAAPTSPGAERTNADYGFQTALFEPDRYQQGANPDPLPPAGPRRARAPQLWLGRARVGKSGRVALRLSCPARGGTGACAGRARLDGARRRIAYSLEAGETRTLRFTLSARRLKRLRADRTMTLGAVALNNAEAGSTLARATITVRAAGA
jgi:CubicO group peptidase (beta-lactamase class C family)